MRIARIVGIAGCVIGLLLTYSAGFSIAGSSQFSAARSADLLRNIGAIHDGDSPLTRSDVEIASECAHEDMRCIITSILGLTMAVVAVGSLIVSAAVARSEMANAAPAGPAMSARAMATNINRDASETDEAWARRIAEAEHSAFIARKA